MAILIHPAEDPAARTEAVRLLRAGRLVVLPTDTVYGVAAHALLPTAIERLYKAKGRPRDKPLAILLADVDQLERVASQVPEAARRLAQRFWPGGLTLVLPKKPELPAILSAGGPGIAVRLPDHSVAREIIRRLGAPVAASSANRSGGPDPRTAQEAVRELGPHLHLVLDGGPSPGGVPSTVVDLTSSPPRIVREGAIPRSAIADLLPDLV
ncbi:MAG: threonylcarbamoyl-AMP synthase [Chloroflexi bacterium]|nr:threonylcarbamoyl-AMP synthase [Chloroflexota bacterium]